MSREIAVIGSPEFTTGFRLAGLQVFENVAEEDKSEELDGAVERMNEHEGVGIVIMHDDDLDYLSRGPRDIVQTSVDPTFVTIGGGQAAGGLRDQIKRAIGIDLMEDTK